MDDEIPKKSNKEKNYEKFGLPSALNINGFKYTLKIQKNQKKLYI